MNRVSCDSSKIATPAGWPLGEYSIICADPPWKPGWPLTGSWAGITHYPLMGDAEILALPVATLAADNCALLLWTTMSRLPLALDVIRAWGFRYATCGFAWAKLGRPGLGHYSRQNAELCLLGIKGTMRPRSRSVRGLVMEPGVRAGRHSQKPGCVRERIVALFGELPRIELFARQPADGWHAWGNEVDWDDGRERGDDRRVDRRRSHAAVRGRRAG